jgi:nicotinate-nucleotide adenylyltransferase
MKNKRIHTKMKIGIFGGTFNPVHYGHLRAAEEVLEKLELDRIVFVPSGNPPLKNKNLADAKLRYEMVKQAISKNPRFSISDIEYKNKNKSYSVDTISTLNNLYPNAKLYFILGIDAFLDMPNWRQAEKLLKLTNFIVISRPSFQFTNIYRSPYLKINKGILRKLDSGRIDFHKIALTNRNQIVMLRLTPFAVSSTAIRDMLKKGKSIKYLLPEKVESYIIFNKIYFGKSDK